MHAMVAAVMGVPIAGAVLCLAVRDKASKYIAVLATAVAAAYASAIAATQSKVTVTFGGLPWLGEGAAKGLFGYQIDPLSVIMLLAATIIGFASVFYSAGYLSKGNRSFPVESGQARYYFWLLLFGGAMAGIALSPTLIQLLIFWELSTVCSWALISFYDDEESLRAGMKYLVMTSFGGLFLMGGVVWVLAATGSVGFDALGQMSPHARAWAFVLFLIAAWAKSAQIPFHTWLPDAMVAPTPINAYLDAATMVKAGVFLVARLLLAGWHLPYDTSLLVSIAALVTMFSALYFYFVQNDIKRLLAFSTIAQLGYIMLGLGIGSMGADLATRGAVLHVLMHAFAKTLLFLSVGVAVYVTGTKDLSQLHGLARRIPTAAVAFFVGAFALTGVPPLPCFWSKLYMLSGALQLKGAFGPVILVLVLIESLVTFAWFLYIGQKIFYGRAPETDSCKVPLCMNAILIALILATILVPIAGIPIAAQIANM
ncbi:MAG: hydrogenase 4 subunit D [Armatimonadota bacterium]|nr:hydrogenase 4 subunit D [Armatimonadota bacterium]